MQKKKNIPAFLRNTYAMLEREELSSVVAWGQGGQGFVIKNLERFSAEILPQYFKHQKYTSFVRQLNMYGFHKQRSHDSTLDANYQFFAHDHFRRGDAQAREQETRLLLAAIRRKPEKKKKTPPGQPPQQAQPPPNEQPEIESFSSVRSVSLEMEGEQREERQERKSSSGSSRGEVRAEQEWSQESSSEFVDAVTEQVMHQNEVLRSLHAAIREEVFEAKKRRIARISFHDPAINQEERASVTRLSALLCQATSGTERMQSQPLF